jgi:hypothetical protein
MSRYYSDLHDRELLNQAESVLMELHRRRMLDVCVPSSTEFVRCPVNAVVRNETVLSLVLERSIEGVAGSK